MWKLAVVAVTLVGCDTKEKPLPPRPEMIDTVRDFADRTCECGTDRACVEPIRAEWEAIKYDVQRHGLTGAELSEFKRELLRFRQCGDAAGLTIWL